MCSSDLLIQQNWLNANGGSCTLAWNPNPDYSVSLSPSSVTVPSTGTTTNYTTTMTPLNGFSGSVSYGSVTVTPAGPTVTPGVNGSFSVTTTSATPTGTYTITETTSGGGLTHDATATLIVSPPPAPTFTLSVSPSTKTVTRPGSTTFVVSVSPQNGFNSPVNLSVTGLRTGLSWSFSPSSLTGGNWSSTLTVTASSSAKRTSDGFTITASSGSVTKSVSATVQVQ